MSSRLSSSLPHLSLSSPRARKPRTGRCSSACKHSWLITWDVRQKGRMIKVPICAGRSLAKAALRVARRQVIMGDFNESCS